MRNKNNITIGQALDRMVSDFKIKGKLDETRIKQSWEQIMGKTISRHTSNVGLKNGKLYITITSASLKQNLTYELETIKNRINEELGTNAVEQVILS
jgi:predicted nucleic acid-binding Zn ribbon protein